MSDINDKKILPSLRIVKSIDWREIITALSSSTIREIALLLDKSLIDERREVYKALEKIDGLTIPYIETSSNMETWELDYLTTNFKTSFIAIATSNAAFTFLSSMTKFASLIIFKNPKDSQSQKLFTDEALTRSNVGGICLDLSSLEELRLYKEKIYSATIHALDHHQLKATHISPFIKTWYSRFIKAQPKRLTSLKQLHYIKYVPAAYFANLIIMDLDNAPEEQKEIQEYLRNIIK